MTDSTSDHPATIKVPQHLAVIMDGNGRWANERGLPRVEGHRAGARSVRMIVEESRKLGIRYLTLYAFSSENWNRPEAEVGALMKLFKRYLESELDLMLTNGIRLRAIGDLDRLPQGVQSTLNEKMEATQHLDGMDLILAISYGARDEICRAVKSMLQAAGEGALRVDDVNPELISSHLDTAGIPDPDLLIRTSSEHRISNFLLWQIAYSEIIVVPQFWPDFSVDCLHGCLQDFGTRQRRFGMTADQLCG